MVVEAVVDQIKIVTVAVAEVIVIVIEIEIVIVRIIIALREIQETQEIQEIKNTLETNTDQTIESRRKANSMARDKMIEIEIDEEAVKDMIEEEEGIEETLVTRCVFQETKKRLKRFLTSS